MYTVFVKCFHLSLEAMRVFREAMRGGEEEEVEKLPKQKKTEASNHWFIRNHDESEVFRRCATIFLFLLSKRRKGEINCFDLNTTPNHWHVNHA